MSDRHSVLTGAGSPSGRAWWAPTMGRMTVKARIATAAVAAALIVIVVIVWNTPTVSSLVGEATADGPTAEEIRLASENRELAEQLRTSQAQADALRDVVGKEQAARKKGEEARAAAQAERDAKAAAEASGTGSARSTATGAGSTTSRSGSTTSASATPKASDKGDGPANPGHPGAGTTPVAAAPAPAVTPTAPTKAALVDPASRYYGMYTEQAPFSWATFDQAATQAERTQNLVGYFGGWDEDFRANAVTRSWERGLLPMLTWESRPIGAGNDVVDEPAYSLPTIISGQHDAYLHQYARDIVSTGLPLAIRLDHEMNGIWYPWAEQTGAGESINGNSPGDYVAMWQHVHDIFEAEGANQYVIWVWAPNIVNNLPSALQGVQTLQSLYPGDAYVDWVGVSGYQRPPYRSDNNNTFDYTYGRTLDQLRSITSKKILLAEVGASEVDGRKPAWVTSFFQGFDPGANDDVIGFAWFNLAVTTYSSGELVTNDWRIGSRANSLEAFRTGLADPARSFGGTPLGVAAEADATADAAVADATAEPTADARAAPTPEPTATTPPDDGTPDASPAPSPTPSPTGSPSPTPGPTATSSPTPTPTPAPTATP